MIFLAIFPLNAAFGNYIVPILIKASDLYWPRWNNIAFWMLIPASIFMYIGLLDSDGLGWTLYAPLSIVTGGLQDLFIIGILIAGVSSVMGSLNFILTIAYMRGPKITWRKMDLFSWSTLFTSGIQIMATPIITTGLVMLLVSRNLGAQFFGTTYLNGPILYQHVFWAYSHPAVYIMVLPAMGMVSILISKFARNAVFGYTSMVISMFAISLIGFIVWGHHLFVTGIIPNVVLSFTSLTYVIAIPSGIKVFNWISTLYGSRIKLEAPILFALAFVVGFTLGGFTGVFVNIVPIDLVFHDTYFVVSHFHYVVIGGTVSAVFGGIYYLLPHMTGRMYNKRVAYWHFITWTVGFIVAFGAMAFLGMLGMPRRYYDYATLQNAGLIETLHQIATIGAFLMAIAFLLFLYNVYWTAKKGPVADKEDPFGLGDGLGLSPPVSEHGHAVEA
jgi:cytochrome c oxidase subunit 1